MPKKFDLRLSFSCLALFLLLYVVLPSFVLSAFLILRVGSPLSAYWVSMAILGGVIFYCRDKLSLWDYAVFFAILIFCHWFSYFFFDNSFDGFAYHEHAIRHIVEGFNPIYDGYMDLGRTADSWSDHATYFPKATWYFAAALTAVFGDIQFGKAYHMLLLFAALMFVMDATKGERFLIRALWVVGVMNPVALNQSTAYVLDGALATLSFIGIFYAYLFFAGKPISRFQHFFCLVSISMLYCVKTTGFAYGGIIIFCIAFHRFVKAYLANVPGAFAKRVPSAVKAAFSLGFKMGIPVLILISVWGAAPYLTNILEGRHIFYPVLGDDSVRSGEISLDDVGDVIYPDAHNRFTKLLYSIASYPSSSHTEPSRLKSPFDVSWPVWEQSISRNIRAAGLGPLFCLLCIVSVPAVFLFRTRGVGWLLFLLAVLLFIQPYAWQSRYSPFLWLVPLVCLMSVPEKWPVVLCVPILIASVNSGGILYAQLADDIGFRVSTSNILSLYTGQTAMLPQTIFSYDGVFHRYGIKQKYINPEETIFYRLSPALGHLPGVRSQDGLNIFFKGDLSPLPEEPLVFSNPASFQWLRMTEGLMPVETMTRSFKKAVEWRTYSDKLKFYMSMEKEPAEDWVLTLKGASFEAKWENQRELEAQVYINNRLIGSWQAAPDTGTAEFVIPRGLLEESFKDETSLVTLMILMPKVQTPVFIENKNQASKYGLRLEEMRFSPLSASAVK